MYINLNKNKKYLTSLNFPTSILGSLVFCSSNFPASIILKYSRCSRLFFLICSSSASFSDFSFSGSFPSGTSPLSNMSRNFAAFSLRTSTLVLMTLFEEELSKSSKASTAFEVPPQFNRFLRACNSRRVLSSFLCFLTSSENSFSVFLL